MKIALGNDHGGAVLRQAVIDVLREAGHEVVDLGTPDQASVDYPDFARPAAQGVASGTYDLAILICGTGQGMAITANKVHGVRAAACAEPYSARMAREHNDANVLCLGGRVVGPGLAQEIVRAFLAGVYAGGRHHRRIQKISDLEAAR